MQNSIIFLLYLEAALSQHVFDPNNPDLVKNSNPPAGAQNNRFLVALAGESLEITCLLINSPGDVTFTSPDILVTVEGRQNTTSEDGDEITSRSLKINNITGSSDDISVLCKSELGNIQAKLEVFEKIVNIPSASCDKGDCQDEVEISYQEKNGQSTEQNVIKRIKQKTGADENLTLKKTLFEILDSDPEGKNTVYMIDEKKRDDNLFEACKCKGGEEDGNLFVLIFGSCGGVVAVVAVVVGYKKREKFGLDDKSGDNAEQNKKTDQVELGEGDPLKTCHSP